MGLVPNFVAWVGAFLRSIPDKFVLTLETWELVAHTL
jgi:hypothetical protein